MGFSTELDGIYGVWLREFKVFLRERERIIGAIFTPLLWMGAFGGGLGASVSIGEYNYQQFVFPGTVAMATLFASMFYGVYLVWDKKLDFFKEVLVAPLSRASIFVGKAAGGITISLIEGAIIVVLGMLIAGVAISPVLFLQALFVIFTLSLGITALGLTIGARMKSPDGFNLIISFVIWPLFILSGAFFPLENLPSYLQIVTQLNPVTYGVDALRGVMLGATHYGILFDLGALWLFNIVAAIVGAIEFGRMKL